MKHATKDKLEHVEVCLFKSIEMIVLIWLLWCLSNTSSNLLHSQKSDGLIANNVIQKSCISSKLLNDADIQSSQ